MLKQFVPAEFSHWSPDSWLRQFRYAMSIKDTDPAAALKVLTDTDYDRWKTICEQVDHIELVAAAIEFLGKSLGNGTKRCLKPRQCDQKIERTIDVAKLAAIDKRDEKMVFNINQLQEKYSQLSDIQAKYADKVQQVKQELQKIKHQSEIQQADDRTKQRKSSLQRQITQEYASQKKVQEKLSKIEREIRILRQIRTTIRPYPCIWRVW